MSREHTRPEAKLWLLTSVFFLIVFIVPTIKLWSVRNLDYAIGDWSIDYSAGFVRRGLAGEALSLAAKLLGVEKLHLLLLVLTVIYSILLFLIYLLFRGSLFAGFGIALLISPGFISGYAIEGYRKELVLYVFLAAFLLLVRRGEVGKFLALILLVTAGPIVVLIHEGLFFGLPFLWFAVVLSVREGLVSLRSALVSVGASVVTAIISLLFSLRYHGNEEVAARICEAQVAEGPARDLCSGIEPLAGSITDAISSVSDVVQIQGYFGVYFFSGLLALLPFLFFKASKFLRVGLILSAGSLVPLAVVGIDWGRWLLLATTASTLIVIAFAGGRDINVARENQHSLNSGWSLLLIIGFSSVWSVPTYGQSQLGNGLIGELLALMAPLWESLFWFD